MSFRQTAAACKIRARGAALPHRAARQALFRRIVRVNMKADAWFGCEEIPRLSEAVESMCAFRLPKSCRRIFFPRLH